MARSPQLKITRNNKGKYIYHIPADKSGTGKRQQKIFDTQRAAQLSRQRDLERFRLYGNAGASLPPAQVEDAARAIELLAPHGVSLTQAAQEAVARIEQQQASRSFQQALEQHLENIEGKSADHQRNSERIGAKLSEQLGADTLICDVTFDRLRNALERISNTAHVFNLHLRSIKPVFTLAAREGWLRENPCSRLQPKDTGRHTIEILSLNQCRQLMYHSAKDFRDRQDWPHHLKVDARGAEAALALLLFGGIRPVELSRLTWEENIILTDDEASVYVSNQKSKTDRSRYFNMHPTLKAWLEQVPPERREGPITPPNWKRVWQAIRKESGIGNVRDGCRKSFASYHLSAFGNVDATREILGHEFSGQVLFSNYRGLCRKKDALAYFQILPDVDMGLKVV